MSIYRSDNAALLARVRALETALSNRPTMVEVEALKTQVSHLLRENNHLHQETHALRTKLIGADSTASHLSTVSSLPGEKAPNAGIVATLAVSALLGILVALMLISSTS
jgi:regulator of replication initiation timing